MIVNGKVWGTTSPIFNRNNVEVHSLRINKGGFCSKHKHRHKSNMFVVTSGKLKVTVWKDYGTDVLEDVSVLTAGTECTVPPGHLHQFEALDDTECLEIYWVSLDEGDIERTTHGGLACGT